VAPSVALIPNYLNDVILDHPLRKELLKLLRDEKSSLNKISLFSDYTITLGLDRPLLNELLRAVRFVTQAVYSTRESTRKESSSKRHKKIRQLTRRLKRFFEAVRARYHQPVGELTHVTLSWWTPQLVEMLALCQLRIESSIKPEIEEAIQRCHRTFAENSATAMTLFCGVYLYDQHLAALLSHGSTTTTDATVSDTESEADSDSADDNSDSDCLCDSDESDGEEQYLARSDPNTLTTVDQDLQRVQDVSLEHVALVRRFLTEGYENKSYSPAFELPHAAPMETTGLSTSFSSGNGPAREFTVHREQLRPQLRYLSGGITKQKSEDPMVKSLLLDPKYEIVSALGQIALMEDDHDSLKAIIDYFDQYQMLIPLIEVAITNEIERTSKSPTLFRDSSLATKLLSLYFFDGIGLPYLKHTVQPILDVILSSDENLEVDPTKAERSVDTAANLEKILQICQNFLNAILDSAPRLPREFHRIFEHARAEVTKKFPDMKQLVIGGFLFLRFICPAVVTPHRYGLAKSAPSPKAGRTLVLISKLLQNLANGVEFDGTKEEYMKRMNRIITRNIDSVRKFLDHLSTNKNHDESLPFNRITSSSSIGADSELLLGAYSALHRALISKKDEVLTRLAEFPDTRAVFTRYLISQDPPVIRTHLQKRGSPFAEAISSLLEKVPRKYGQLVLGLDQDTTAFASVSRPSFRRRLDRLLRTDTDLELAEVVTCALQLHDEAERLFGLWPIDEKALQEIRPYLCQSICVFSHLLERLRQADPPYSSPSVWQAWQSFFDLIDCVNNFLAERLGNGTLTHSLACSALSTLIVQLRWNVCRLTELQRLSFSLPITFQHF